MHKRHSDVQYIMVRTNLHKRRSVQKNPKEMEYYRRALNEQKMILWTRQIYLAEERTKRQRKIVIEFHEHFLDANVCRTFFFIRFDLSYCLREYNKIQNDEVTIA